MPTLSSGDLARHLMLRQQTSSLKAAIQRHGTEFTTGRATDPGSRLKGDFSAAAGIDRSITRLSAFRMAGNEAALFTGGLQRTLETAQNLASDVGTRMLSVAGLNQKIAMDVAFNDAKEKFFSAVSVLNTQIAGRSLLSGDATGNQALMSADDILTSLAAVTAGMTDPQTLQQTVRNWFSDGNAYQGSETPLAPFKVSEGETIRLEVTAADPAISDMLSGFAMAAMLAGDLFSNDQSARGIFARMAGESMLGAEMSISTLRASVGMAEARIDVAVTRNATEGIALEIARHDLTGVDSFDAATRLESSKTQLEALYAVTARLSRLSLTDFLR